MKRYSAIASSRTKFLRSQKTRIALKGRQNGKHDGLAEKAWDLAKQAYMMHGIFAQNKAKFFSPLLDRCLSSPSIIEPQEREFVVDSGGSMHMLNKKDMNSAELETVRISRRRTTVITANGSHNKKTKKQQRTSETWTYS